MNYLTDNISAQDELEELEITAAESLRGENAGGINAPLDAPQPFYIFGWEVGERILSPESIVDVQVGVVQPGVRSSRRSSFDPSVGMTIDDHVIVGVQPGEDQELDW